MFEDISLSYPPAAAAAGGTADITRISGATGAAGVDITYQTLTSNSADNTTVTLATVMTTTGLGAGTWRYRFEGNYQTAALTTGISMVTNFTGTVTAGKFAKRWSHVTTGASASTGTGDDVAGTLTGQIVEAHSHNVNNTDEGPTAGVATINANVGFVCEGFAVTTTSGDLQFRIRSEVAASAVRIMAGTSLVLQKIA